MCVFIYEGWREGRAVERKEEDATGGDRGQADRDVGGGKARVSVGGVLGVRVCVWDVGGRGMRGSGRKRNVCG